MIDFNHSDPFLVSEHPLAAAEFTGDGRPDLLVTGKDPRMLKPPLCVYELDGRPHRVSLGGWAMFYEAAPYDFDADGISEIAILTTDSQRVVNLQGKTVAELPGYIIGGRFPLNADINGDGHRELLVGRDYELDTLMALGPGAGIIWRTSLTGSLFAHAMGDVDGDGMDELISHRDGPAIAQGLNQHDQQLTDGSFEPVKLYCADITGDGRDELIDPGIGYYDLAEGTLVPLRWPEPGSYSKTSFANHIEVAALDINGDSRRELILTDNPYVGFRPVGSGVYVFEQDGSLIYHEEFGEYVLGITVIDDRGTERLVVYTRARLLIYP